MRIGLSTPIVVQVPGVASPWEATGTHDDLSEIARMADRLGLDFLTCSEHVAVPSVEAPRRGAVYWDPLSTFGFLAADTRRIRLATAVVVLGYHHPLEIAKRYGTLDRIRGLEDDQPLRRARHGRLTFTPRTGRLGLLPFSGPGSRHRSRRHHGRAVRVAGVTATSTAPAGQQVGSSGVGLVSTGIPGMACGSQSLRTAPSRWHLAHHATHESHAGRRPGRTPAAHQWSGG